jgi:hypothetical protein
MSPAFPSRWLSKRSIAALALAYIAIAVGSGNRRIDPERGSGSARPSTKEATAKTAS